MTVQECYKMMEADYEDVLQRLLSDERIKKYLGRLLDTDELQQVEQTLAEEKYEEAFRHVHNLKGLSLNLGLTSLRGSSDVLCEALRGGEPIVDVTPLLMEVKRDYETIKAAIQQLLNNSEKK